MLTRCKTDNAVGGVWGLAEGLQRTPVSAPPKIRLNAVLNSVTRRGPFLGNNAGVVAMIYNGINSFIGYVRGKHDATNSIAAGALSGMLFKSTRGPRQMMISGGLVATAAGIWAVRLEANPQLVSVANFVLLLGDTKGCLRVILLLLRFTIDIWTFAWRFAWRFTWHLRVFVLIWEHI
jgi:inner membrane translocase subunit Tim23